MILALGLFACVTADNFLHTANALGCKRLDECDKGAFESNYSSLSDCEQTNDNNGDAANQCYIDNCDFDPKAAATCIKAIRTDDCSQIQQFDYANDCDPADVYPRCDDNALGECLINTVF